MSTTPRPFQHAAFAGFIGVAREDITPPVGIYYRNWGAAKHDAAEGIHRPMTLTALTLQEEPTSAPLVLVEADIGGWWGNLPLERRFRRRVLDALKLDATRFIFASSHSHSAPPTSEKPDPRWQGGEMLPAYLEKLFDATLRAAQRALAAAQPATLDWHTGHCSLATDRDLPHGDRKVCGYNPGVRADDTLVVGRVTDSSGKIIATIVNYACHPTTLAWDNKLISPDYVGAMRATMQDNTGAPALFLQGASGELSPRYQYIGDTAVADSHGRQLAFAALATLADMEPVGQALVYDGVVESGAPLAAWKREPVGVSRDLFAEVRTVPLPVKDWPTADQLKRDYETSTDRALAERVRRKLMIREGIGDGKTFPLEMWHWRIGNAELTGAFPESYSWVQKEVRSKFPDRTIVWLNLINGSVGYMPPAALYDGNVYQVWQTPFERGSLEMLAKAAQDAIAKPS
jgi:hypothetical protein